MIFTHPLCAHGRALKSQKGKAFLQNFKFPWMENKNRKTPIACAHGRALKSQKGKAFLQSFKTPRRAF